MLGSLTAGCSLSKTFKILLLFCGVLFFYEYFLDARRTSTIYTSGGVPKAAAFNQWPKRTQSRHCFDGTTDSTPLTSSTTENSTSFLNSNTSTTVGDLNAANRTDQKDIMVNVHNATQRYAIVNVESTSPGSNDTKASNATSDDVDNVEGKNRSTTTNNFTVTSQTSDANVANDSLNDNIKETPSVSPAGCEIPCPAIPPGLVGAIEVDLAEISLQDLEKHQIDVALGGHFAPRECKPKDKVAIIIPYRDREAHLAIFLKNLHPFLMKQQIEYQIYVVEQQGKGKFNRATLMNVGYVQALEEYPWDCFIFHDVDLLPLDDRNLYTCPSQPRHLSAAIDKFNFKLPYSTIFGGVSALTTEQFKKVNGFSNNFWGWGGEDDDMANRILYHNFHISRYPMSIARYTMLSHDKENPNPRRFEALTKGKRVYNTVGLNNLQYTLVEKKKHNLYTQLLVELHPPS